MIKIRIIKANSSKLKIKAVCQKTGGYIHKEWVISVDAVIRPIVLIPQFLAGGFHG